MKRNFLQSTQAMVHWELNQWLNSTQHFHKPLFRPTLHIILYHPNTEQSIISTIKTYPKKIRIFSNKSRWIITKSMHSNPNTLQLATTNYQIRAISKHRSNLPANQDPQMPITQPTKTKTHFIRKVKHQNTSRKNHQIIKSITN